MKTLGFPKSHRLLKPSDYSKVFDDVALKVPHRNFLILATPNDRGHARIGLIFSKKNLRLAVQRNRIKRQVRETFRLQQDLPSLDIIVLGRQGLSQLDNTAVRSS
ncbi:MAG: ribonuclease P protein component, partial [Marinobacter sp.]|nr:ribonuclease P protein component [Marinobacter sp.]